MVIDGGRCAFIDRDVLEAITEFKQSSIMKNIDVILEGIEEVERRIAGGRLLERLPRGLGDITRNSKFLHIFRV